MIHARASQLPPAGLLTAGLALALGLRMAIAGGEGTQSAVAGLAFAAALGALVMASPWRPDVPRLRDALVGIAGGSVLVLPALYFRATTLVPVLGFPASSFPTWVVVVGTVALAEELVLRGTLFSALATTWGVIAAVGVTAVVFALLHVPLYGWGALPLDLAAGVWLGGLRAATGSVTAPVVAHLLADVAAWWVL